jgi:hypothetical protein
MPPTHEPSEPAPRNAETGRPWWGWRPETATLTPRQVHRHLARNATIGASLFLIATTSLWWVLSATEVKDIDETDFGYYAHKQSTNALVGGCGPMYSAPLSQALDTSGTVPDKDRAGIPNRVTYPNVVPMFGEFWDVPAPEDQALWSFDEPNAPKPENLLRNMWDGTMVAYYTEAVSEEEIELFHSILDLHPEMDLKVIPWDSSVRGPLPENRDVAFATWNASQSCHRLIAPALYDFREAHPASDAPGHNGTEPPVRSTQRPYSVTR